MFFFKAKNAKNEMFLKRPIIMFIVLMVLLSLLPPISIGTEDTKTTLGNGKTEEIITFPSGGGYNNELNLSLPADVTITDAEMELRGLGVQSVVKQFKHEFNDTVNNTAWKGVTAQNPPTSNPSTFTTTKFTSKENPDIRSSDNVRAVYTGSGLNNYPYHLFRFNITETAINTLNVYWEGYGHFKGFMFVPYWAYLFIWNSTAKAWESLGSNSSFSPPVDFVIQSSSFSNPSDYIDSSKQLFLMAQGTGIVDNTYTSDIFTDYVKVEIQGLGIFFPTDVTLDIGDDGDIEWQFPGSFHQNVTIKDGNNFKSELQSLIDSATPGGQFVEIPLKFTSTTEGKLKISNISIKYELPVYNLPPYLLEEIPDTYGFYEDTNGGDNLIDLNDYYGDDRDNGSLIYSILKNNNKVSAELDADGHHLDFSSEQDHFGVYEFQVNATDKGYDGVVGGDVDLFAKSNVFTVSVWPTNDAPVINSVGEVAIPNDKTELTIKGSGGAREDEWFNITISAHDIDGDALSFSCNLTLPSPASLEIITDPINENSANLSIYATNDYVGTLEFNISVIDDFESAFSRTQEPSSGPLSDYINLIIEVHNTNDRPKMISTDEIIGAEDQWLNFTLNAKDDDLKFGDKLWFSTNMTKAIDSLMKGKNYEFNDYSGAVSLLPNNDMVGVYWVEFKVSDEEGAKDTETVKIIINNMNDLPFNVLSWPLAKDKFNTSSMIHFDGSNSTDIDLVHGDSLKFEWSSNISGVLGTGPKLTRNISDVGWHEITLTVTDSSNTAVQESILIQITAVPVADDKDKDGDGDGDGDGGSDNLNKDESKSSDNSILVAIMIIIIIIVIIGSLLFVRHRKNVTDEIESDPEGTGLTLSAPQAQNPPLAPPFPMMPMPTQPPIQPPIQPYPNTYPSQYPQQPGQPFIQPALAQSQPQPIIWPLQQTQTQPQPPQQNPTKSSKGDD